MSFLHVVTSLALYHLGLEERRSIRHAVYVVTKSQHESRGLGVQSVFENK